MAPHSKTIRLILTTVLSLLIGLLVLQALGYGVGFAIDPEGGVKEFGNEGSSEADDLTVTLVGLVGVGMLGIAALLILSAILVWRANPVGTYVSMMKKEKGGTTPTFRAGEIGETQVTSQCLYKSVDSSDLNVHITGRLSLLTPETKPAQSTVLRF